MGEIRANNENTTGDDATLRLIAMEMGQLWGAGEDLLSSVQIRRLKLEGMFLKRSSLRA